MRPREPTVTEALATLRILAMQRMVKRRNRVGSAVKGSVIKGIVNYTHYFEDTVYPLLKQIHCWRISTSSVTIMPKVALCIIETGEQRTSVIK